MAKSIVILAEQMYQELEIWYPLYRLREAGYTVVVAGPEAGKVYPSKLGYPCKADISFADLNADNADGVVVPGGMSPDYIRRDERANRFVKEINDQVKLVAAICHGPWVLCSAYGMLRGRKATCFFAIKDDVINAGAEYIDAEVVVDGNLVTSRKPDDLPAFMQASLEVLAKQDKA
jgi:protease I